MAHREAQPRISEREGVRKRARTGMPQQHICAFERAGEWSTRAECVLYEFAIDSPEFYSEFVTTGACLNSETP